jgi:hypothetical protein
MQKVSKFPENLPISRIRPGIGITPSGVDPQKEIITQRGERSKTWDIGNNQRRTRVGLTALHYRDNPNDEKESWRDIDLSLESDNTCHKAPYDVQIYTNKIGFSYVSKRGGRIDVELDKVGDIPVDNSRFNFIQDGNQIFWNNVASNLNMKVLLRPQGVEIFKQLLNDQAAKKFRWKIKKWKGSKCDFKRELAGMDSKVTGPGPINSHNPGRLEIVTNVVLDRDEIDSEIYLMDEEWTGNVGRIIDKKTRQKTWIKDAQYPVVIDAVVNEAITAGADDVQENGDATLVAGGSFITMHTVGTKKGGFRFVSVGLPQGANITAVSVGFNNHYCYGTPQKLYFSNVDNAPAWATNDRPSQMGNKLAAVTWTPINTANSNEYFTGMTAAIQTIVNRGGWSSGNAIRFGVVPTYKAPTSARHDVAAYEYTARLPAQLDITYTVGGNAPTGNLNGPLVGVLGGVI